MIVANEIIEALKGERFSQIMSGFNFDTAAQITVALYKAGETGISLAWLKTPSQTYPQAGVIEKREDGKMVFTIDTQSLSTGKYEIEARVDVVGVLAPIVKQRSEFLTLKPSRT